MRTFNIGGGSPVRLDSMLSQLAAALDCPVHAKRVPPPPGDVPQTWASIERARTELTWEPHVDFAEGVQRAAAWLLQLHATHGVMQKVG